MKSILFTSAVMVGLLGLGLAIGSIPELYPREGAIVMGVTAFILVICGLYVVAYEAGKKARK